LVEDPVHNIVQVHEPKVMVMVSQFLSEPAFHCRLNLRLCVSVAYEDTLTLIDRTVELQGGYIYKKDFFELRSDVSPDWDRDVAAFGLIHTEDMTATFLKQNCDILPILKGTVPDLSICRRSRGSLQKPQY
jgi:hypothetical protein